MIRNKSLTKTVYKSIFVISSILFAVSVAVHALTLFNINLQEKFPPVYLLHFLLFVLIAPIFLMQKLEDNEEDKKAVSLTGETQQPKVDNEEKIENKSNLQKWLFIIYMILGFYVFINFAIFISGVKGQPVIVDGKYVLREKGTVIRESTKEEFDIESAKQLRAFSGHWLIFYFYISSTSFINGFKRKDLGQ